MQHSIGKHAADVVLVSRRRVAGDDGGPGDDYSYCVAMAADDLSAVLQFLCRLRLIALFEFVLDG